MARHASWLARIDSFLAWLEKDPRQEFTRQEIADLLAIKPTRAHALMTDWGASLRHGTHGPLVVTRAQLVTALRAAPEEAAAQRLAARARREDLVHAVAAGKPPKDPALDRYAIRLRGERTPVQSLDALPPTIRWQPVATDPASGAIVPGVLTIRYDHPRELAEALVALSEALILCREDLVAREDGWPQTLAVRYASATAPPSSAPAADSPAAAAPPAGHELGGALDRLLGRRASALRAAQTF